MMQHATISRREIAEALKDQPPEVRRVWQAQRRAKPVQMKAIVVHQPWADMIASGKKTIETRTWKTKHRGPLLIIAAARPKVGAMPAGVAVAVVDLQECREMTDADQAAACCGIFPRAKSWVLGNVKRIAEPFKIRGWQKIFTVSVDPAALA